jgi:hypothetical protein
MEKKSIEKLLAAGYILLRSEDGGSMGDKHKIKYSDSYGTWRTLETFNTKAARDRRINELLDDNYYYLFL